MVRPHQTNPDARSRGASRLAIASAALILLGSATSAAHASEGLIVTSTRGESQLGEAENEMLAVIEPGQMLEMEDGATCSVLMANNAVVQVCAGAALSFERERGRGGPGSINIRKGEIKTNVSPQSDDEPMEIHTPAAIATLLGTVVHVYVDAETGESVVTAIEHHVRVASRDPEIKESVVLAPGEQVTVVVGEKPGRVHRIDPLAFSRSSDCLDDDDYRAAALAAIRGRYLDDTLLPILTQDIPDGPLSPVSSALASQLPIDTTINVDTAGCLPGTGCSNPGASQDPGGGIIVDPIPPTGPPGRNLPPVQEY